MNYKKTGSSLLFYILGYTIIISVAIFCLIPFWIIIAGSFTANDAIYQYGYNILPKVFSLDAYKFIFARPDSMIRAYMVTGMVTAVGTFLGLFMITMAGYVLQRKDFKYRNKISFFIYFTTLFQGGLIPWYILITKYLRLQDSYLALILPSLMSPFLIILMKNFIRSSVPDEITEAAKIDGANDFKIFYRIVIHIAKPGIASVGLFLALAYWNDWYLSLLFINSQAKYSLQFFLYNMLASAEAMQNMANKGMAVVIKVPTESTKMAMAVVATGPIIFLYPFIQKYFVKGLTVGAVKG